MSVTDWKYPGTAANVDRDSKAAWTNPTYAQADDTNYATADIGKNTYSDWLFCTNFGFSTLDIPECSAINGIQVVIYCSGEAVGPDTPVWDDSVYIVNNSTQVGDNKAWGNPYAYQPNFSEISYGGSSDTWNCGLDDSDIRGSSFGVCLSSFNNNVTGTYMSYVDYVKIRIYYTAPTTTTTTISTTSSTTTTTSSSSSSTTTTTSSSSSSTTTTTSSSSSSTTSSTSSSSSTSTTTTSPPLGTVVWGHHTDVDEANDENFVSNWSSGPFGSGDEEVMYLADSPELSTPWHLGVGYARILLNKYRPKDSATIYYKTGATAAACIADEWNLFDTSFYSEGFVLIKLEE